MKRYQINYSEDGRYTVPIDTVYAEEDYTAEDYIRDCEENADEGYCNILRSGTVTIEEA